MKKLLSIWCIFAFVTCFSDNAFSQSPLPAREILIKKYKLFTESKEFSTLYADLEKVLSEQYKSQPKQKRIISNTIFINACDFSLLKNSNAITGKSHKPKLEPQDLMLSTIKYDTLLTKPCVTTNRITSGKVRLPDYFLFTADVDKLSPLMKKKDYKVQDLDNANKFLDLYQAVVPSAKQFPKYGFLIQAFNSNFFKIQALLDYLRVNIVLQIEDDTLYKNVDEMLNAYSDQIGHLFRTIPATYSEAFRPPVPSHSGHPFRVIPATRSQINRPGSRSVATLLFYIVKIAFFSQ